MARSQPHKHEPFLLALNAQSLVCINLLTCIHVQHKMLPTQQISPIMMLFPHDSWNFAASITEQMSAI